MKILFESVYLIKSANYFAFLKEIDNVKIENIQHFSDRYDRHIYMKGIITGNIIESDAKKELKSIEELINSTILAKK